MVWAFAFPLGALFFLVDLFFGRFWIVMVGELESQDAGVLDQSASPSFSVVPLSAAALVSPTLPAAVL
jgi:hypothetical protein